jgi:hypothetical protein
MVWYRVLRVSEVNNIDWSRPTTPAEVIARAGGRRRYNAQRQDEAVIRLCRMLGLFREYGVGYGVKARIARELGVHRSTITRDFRAAVWIHERECPTCLTMVDDKQWERVADYQGFGIHPLSEQGQQDIWAVNAIRDALPMVLGDFGFYVGYDDEVITHPDVPSVEEKKVTVADLACKIAAGAFTI